MRRMLMASLTGHARRLIAGVIAIVLSVAFLAVVLTAMDSARTSITRAIAGQYAAADLVVSGARSPEAVDAIGQVDGVDAVAQITSGYLQVTLPDGKRVDQGADGVPSAESLRWQEPAEGELPDESGEVALSVAFTEEYDVAVGDELTVASRAADSATMTVVGTVDVSTVLGSASVLLPEQVLAGGIGYGRDVLVAGAPDESAVQRAAEETASESVTGGTVEVRSTDEVVDERLRNLTSGVNVLGGLLLGFVAIALFVAVLVVANTFTIVIAQRSRELALFRCVGASQRQIFRVVVVEALIVGLVGSVLGLLLGIGLTRVGLSIAENYVDALPIDTITVSPVSVVIALGIGTVVTVLAALRPAGRATGVPPLAALRPEGASPVKSRKGKARLVFGGIFLAVGAALMAGALLSDGAVASAAMGVLGGVLSFDGVLWIGPILVPAVVRLLGTIARATGVPGKVSVDNSTRNPQRTATTASALLIGVTLISLLVVGAATAQRTAGEAMDEQYPVDLVVRPETSPGASEIPDGEEPLARAEELPETVRETVGSLDGVRNVAVGQGVLASISPPDQVSEGAGPTQLPTPVAAVDQEKMRQVVRDSGPYGSVEPGTVVLSPGVASNSDIADGEDVLVWAGPEHQATMTARVADLSDFEPRAMVAAGDLERLAPYEPATIGIWVQFSDGVELSAVSDAISEVQQAVPSARIDGSVQMRALMQQVIDVLLLIAVVLLTMAVLIAFVGVWNTLSLSVLERTRENALLRALGLTRRQLRGTLAVEAALIAGAAVLIGLVLGVIYGYVGIQSVFATVPQVDQVALTIPWGRVGLTVLVALVAGVLASLLPARSAARTPPAGNL